MPCFFCWVTCLLIWSKTLSISSFTKGSCWTMVNMAVIVCLSEMFLVYELIEWGLNINNTFAPPPLLEVDWLLISVMVASRLNHLEVSLEGEVMGRLDRELLMGQKLEQQLADHRHDAQVKEEANKCYAEEMWYSNAVISPGATTWLRWVFGWLHEPKRHTAPSKAYSPTSSNFYLSIFHPFRSASTCHSTTLKSCHIWLHPYTCKNDHTYKQYQLFTSVSSPS